MSPSRDPAPAPPPDDRDDQPDEDEPSRPAPADEPEAPATEPSPSDQSEPAAEPEAPPTAPADDSGEPAAASPLEPDTPTQPEPQAEVPEEAEGTPPPEGRQRRSRLRRRRPPRTAPTVGSPGKLTWPSFRVFRDIRLPSALQNDLYRRYWLSQIVSLSGTWMQNTGSQLVVLSVTTSAVLIGAINVVAAIPLLLLSLSGGVVADTYDRRKIMIGANWLLILFALIYAALLFTDRIEYWHIVLLAFASGTVAAFELPAVQAFVPQLVKREDLPQAVALNSAVFNAARSVGPAIAAVLIGALGLVAAFLVNAVALLFPIAVLIGFRNRVAPQKGKVVRGSSMESLREGIRYVREHDDLKGLIFMTALLSFAVMPNLIVLMPLYVSETLGGGFTWVPVFTSIVGIGSLIGALTLLRGSRLEAAASKRLRTALVGLSFGLVWLALAPSPWFAIPGVVIMGFSFAMGNSQIQTRVQQLAPDEMRGRILSILSLAFNGMMPFATIAVSIASQAIGQQVVQAVCAVLLAGGAIYVWRNFAWKAFVPPEPLVAPAGEDT